MKTNLFLLLIAATSLAQTPLPVDIDPAKRTPGPGMVASELRAKGGGKDVAAGAIVFDGPMGNGRRGAKGVLLKNTPMTGSQGSNWSFRYSIDGTAYGVQIIHPHAKGQVIVHLSRNNVGISAPKAWTEIGWTNGSNKAVKKTPNWDKQFPLVEGQPTAIESRLSANGQYEIAINGLVVASARFSAKAHPLSINIPPDKKYPLDGYMHTPFKGPDLPMEWSAGYAALLLSPLDGGANIAREITFRPSPK